MRDLAVCKNDVAEKNDIAEKNGVAEKNDAPVNAAGGGVPCAG